MILVTGASGNLGSLTIEYLSKKTAPSNIIAFTRDEEKAQEYRAKGIEARIGDFDDPTSLDRAFEGVDTLLMISTLDPNRYQQHKNVVDAAKRAGVKHVVYTSVAMENPETSVIRPLMESHFQTESYIRESGLTYTLLRNSLYMQVLPQFLGQNVFETGVYVPAGNGKAPFVLREELAEAAAEVLATTGHENKTYELTGAELYSFQDVADVLSGISGKELAYTAAKEETFGEELRAAGVPEIGILITNGFTVDIKNQQYNQVSDDLEGLLGRKPTSLKEGLAMIYEQ